MTCWGSKCQWRGNIFVERRYSLCDGNTFESTLVQPYLPHAGCQQPLRHFVQSYKSSDHRFCSSMKGASNEACKSPDSTGGKAQTSDPFPAVKKPPPEPVNDIRVRSFVIFAFWAIVIFLGLPVWWWTTSIHRSRLPLQEMLEWADGKVGP